MNKKHYITAITYILLLRILDLGLTFIYTPDLRYEWNPVVSVFNYSWIGMLITQVLIICLILNQIYGCTIDLFPSHMRVWHMIV